jgi:polar amino acid transport system substrate-binding protein
MISYLIWAWKAKSCRASVNRCPLLFAGPVFALFFSLLLLVHAGTAFAQGSVTVASLRPLQVGITHDPPFTIKTEEGKWTGLNVEVWRYLARELKVDYVLQEMTPAEIMKGLADGRIDLTICALYITAEREKLIDFSTPLGSSRIMVAAVPEKIEHPVHAALRIFLSWGTVKVMGFLAFLLLLAGFTVWVIERKKNPEHFGGGLVRGWISGIYWVGSTLASGVCVGINLKSLTGRLLGLLWMFVCALVLSAFVAGLTSSLTLKSLSAESISVKTLRTLRLGAIKGTVYTSMLDRLHIPYKSFSQIDDALQALVNKSIDAFLYGENGLRHLVERDYKDRVSLYPSEFRRAPYAFGIAPTSNLRKPVNAVLLDFMDDPLWEQLQDRFGVAEAVPASTRGTDRRRNP